MPACAAILGFVLSTLFDLTYISAAGKRMSEQNTQMAERLADTVAVPLAVGDIPAVQAIVDRIAPENAVIVDDTGAVLAGSASNQIKRKRDGIPILNADGETLATLHAGQIVPSGFLIPIPILAGTTLLVTALSFWLGSFFARTASGQLEALGETVKVTASGKGSGTGPANFVFEEFRKLHVILARTIKHLRTENTRLQEAAYTDERTGLGNSARLTRDLTAKITSSSFEEPAAYVLVEAEGLQLFSDPHTAVLPNEFHGVIAKRLAKLVAAQEDGYSMPRGSWPVFSLQSDEFAILVDRVGGRTEVMRFVRGVLEALRQPFEVAGQTIRLPARAGIVMIPEDGQSALDIRRRAESALYQSRRSDEVNIQFYSPKLERQSAARKRLESEVRAAVEKRRFIPVFQPKVDLKTGRIVGAEALARWKLESGRIVSPGVFIPVAESTGLIGEIGMQVTEQACRAAAMWHGRGFKDVSVAVNVSPLQFESDDLGTMLIRAMSEAGLPPRLLQLEITETVAVSDPDRLLDVIGPLKSMGVRLAIDDFGTGHSNLAMLGRLPYDVFKIDRAFISSLHSDKQAPAIVEMILGMAETLGMETVAEGVETEAQEAFLRQRGCDQYQGYYYIPPVSLEKFVQLLAADRAGAASRAG